jgi:vacuolar protein sorting-associated protein 26
MSIFFTTNPNVTFAFNGSASRPKKLVRVPGGGAQEEQLIYGGQEPVSGTVELSVPPGKKVEHLGVKIELIGQIELNSERGSAVKFTSIVRELESAGIMVGTKTYPFEFNGEKVHESYSGINVRLRYFVRITVTRNYNGSFVKEQDFSVQNVQSAALQAQAAELPATAIKMEVGIEECLHIEFEYDRAKYHLQDVILGKINFLLVRIKIKHMELAVIRRESAGNPPNTYNDAETVTKYELMDGAPVKGETVPIRLFLAPLELTPSYRVANSQCTFSVKYYLNLVLIDEEDRRYFKQQEVTFWRKGEDPTSYASERGSEVSRRLL